MKTGKSKKATKNSGKQSGGITDKKDDNAGSGAFNQGSAQDPEYNKGVSVSDEEKETGESHDTGSAKTDGKIKKQ